MVFYIIKLVDMIELLLVSLCYLYCIDLYGQIQKLVCATCGLLVVVDERYQILFAFARYLTILCPCNMIVLYEMCAMTTLIYMCC